VAPGECLWSIAQDHLADLGRPTDDRSVDRYWRTLVEHNRSILADPGNPSLIFTGQQIALPPP
jgi:hypothetical protein